MMTTILRRVPRPLSADLDCFWLLSRLVDLVCDIGPLHIKCQNGRSTFGLQINTGINSVWFSAFQVVGAWANTGFSLVDQNLIPFQTAYPLLVSMVWLVLAGNTGFPIFLRLTIWINYKLTWKRSKWGDPSLFDHPRRCFIYLLPSRQTWFLLTVLVILNFTDWFLFLVLNIGIPVFDVVLLGRRLLLGLVQAASVRFADFQSIAISALVPALQLTCEGVAMATNAVCGRPTFTRNPRFAFLKTKRKTSALRRRISP
ncbi:cation transport protein-domain-containing protein [Lactarius deliciosus]|nr:cation transport protein-domain-containing protein [Lactarius deliciosus]